MVEPITMMAIAGAVSGGAKLIGGLIGKANAQKQAEYQAKLYEEQAAINDLLYSRKIAVETGTAVANTGGRGVAVTGTVADTISARLYDAQLERVIRKQDILRQIEMNNIQGAQAGQNAMIGGVTGAAGTASDVATTYFKENYNKDKALPADTKNT